MRYLPILQELFESDTYILMLIGLGVAFIAGMLSKNGKGCIKGLLVSAGAYVICEAATQLHTNYAVQFFLLFAGTTAIGCVIGFAGSAIVLSLRGRRGIR